MAIARRSGQQNHSNNSGAKLCQDARDDYTMVILKVMIDCCLHLNVEYCVEIAYRAVML